MTLIIYTFRERYLGCEYLV